MMIPILQMSSLNSIDGIRIANIISSKRLIRIQSELRGRAYGSRPEIGCHIYRVLPHWTYHFFSQILQQQPYMPSAFTVVLTEVGTQTKLLAHSLLWIPDCSRG